MQTVTIQVKNNYGAMVAYPVCERAQHFASIAGTKTLTAEALKHIKALGFEIIQHTETMKF